MVYIQKLLLKMINNQISKVTLQQKYLVYNSLIPSIDWESCDCNLLYGNKIIKYLKLGRI